MLAELSYAFQLLHVGVNWVPSNYLLAHDPLSTLVYPTITHTSLVAGNLPLKLWLLGNGQQ